MGEWLPLRLLDSYAIVLLAMYVSKYVLAMYVSMYAYAAGGRCEIGCTGSSTTASTHGPRSGIASKTLRTH